MSTMALPIMTPSAIDAIAYVEKIAPTMAKDQIIICTLSGRGDKDVASIAKYKGVDVDE